MNRQILLSYFQRVIYLVVMPIHISLLTNNLTVENYGMFNLIINTGVVATIVFSLGVQHYQSITIPKYREIKQLIIFKNLYVMELLTYMFFSFSVYLIVSVYGISVFNTIPLKLIIVFFAFYLLNNEIGRFYAYIHKSEVKIILNIVEQLLLLSLLFLVIHFYKEKFISLELLLYIYIATHFVILFIYLLIFKNKRIFISISLNRNIMKKAILFGFPMILSELIWRLMQNTDSYVFLYYNYQYELGVYSFIIKISSVAYLISSPFLWIMYPYIVKASGDNVKMMQMLTKQINMTVMFSFFALAFYLINIELLLDFVAHSDYAENLIYYYMSSIYPILLLFVYITYQQLMINKNKGVILKSYVSGFLINAVFSYFLIEDYHIYGAIVSTSMGLIATLLMLLNGVNSKDIRNTIVLSLLSSVSRILLIVVVVFIVKDILVLNFLLCLYFIFYAYKKSLYGELREMILKR